MKRKRQVESEPGSQSADLVCVLGKQQNTQNGKMGSTPVHQKCRQC